MISIALKFLWTWIKKIPYQVWFLVGAVLALWLFGNWQFHRGAQSVQVKWDASREQGKVLVAQLREAAAKVNERVVERVVTRTEVLHGKTQFILKEVPHYIPADTPDLPAGFRLLHDAAASSELPREATATDSPVSVADVATTVTLNYETCYQWRHQLDAWDQWYEEQSRAWKASQHK